MNREQVKPRPPIMHASRSIEAVRPASNDERRASWAARYFGTGMHRQPQKPRIRVTVPQSRPVKDCPQPDGQPIRELVTSDGRLITFDQKA